MEKGSFIFYASFDEALKELPDKSRLKIYDAICDYALRGIEQDLSGVEKAVLSLIKPQLKANNQRYENGCKGGRPKKNQNETDGFSEEETKTKPKKNQTETKSKPNENENVNVNEKDITPLCISPLREKKNANPFFEKYAKFATYKGKVEGIDFDRLLVEFDKSSYLRSLYTFKQVLAIYDGILNGDYRDKMTATDAVNARADREIFYSARRQQAEKEADKVLEMAMSNKWYAENAKALSAMQIALAKAKLYDQEKVDELKRANAALLETKRKLLADMGLTEEDLKPKYVCEKCKDTGFMKDGKACDCYTRDK